MQWYVKNYKRSYCAVLSGILSNFLAYFYLEVAEAGTLCISCGCTVQVYLCPLFLVSKASVSQQHNGNMAVR